MNKFIRWLLILVVGMIGAYVFYKSYSVSSVWGFTVSFLGGAIIILLAASIEKICKRRGTNR
jgi:RsiW-degrading membrane proteinase PrsW (M82 family)